MTNQQTGVMCFLLGIGVLLVGLYAIAKLKGRDEWYSEGWHDCVKAYRHFDMTKDDEIVLKHLKSALRAYIDTKGYRQKGDVKKVSQIKDFDELRHTAWEICCREKPKGKKRV